MYAVCGAWAPSLRNTAAELAVGFAVAVVVTDSVTVTAAVCLVVGAAAAAVMTQSLALNKHQTQRRCDRRLAFRAMIHQSQTELGRNACRRSALSISRKIETHTPIKALIMDP